MKKLLTLVLALALMFAIAAPAMAITGDTTDYDEISEVDFVSLDVALFTNEPVPSQFGGFSLSTVASNKLYIINEVAYYGVAVRFVEIDPTDLYNDYNLDPTDYQGSDLTITSDALELRTIRDIFKITKNGKMVDIDTKGTVSNGKIVMENFPDAWGTGATVYLFGEGVVKQKGIIRAVFEQDYSFEHGETLTIYDGTDKLFDVTHRADGFEVHDYENEGFVFFKVNESGTHKDEVSNIYVDLAGNTTGYQEVIYTVPVSGGGAVLEKIGTFADDDLKDAKDVYKNVMNFFGFNYNAEGRLLPKHFAAKAAGLYLKDEVAINLYTGSIVQPDPNVQPPKTGDTASVMGFAMIALALVAAGFVVSKKVRA
jgi:LPXTG-motif cell wall-anchored protein